MEERNTPRYPCLDNPKHDISKPPDWSFGIATPTSISFTSPQVAEADRTTMSLILKSPTQALVDCNQQLKRVQQDLLVLTSFNDNSTLHWRPSWFAQAPFNNRFWTLHNPLNVVTEKLPSNVLRGKEYHTRRMRRESDPPASYIKSWDHWRHVCDMYGIPQDFLCEQQVEQLRLGLTRDRKGILCRKTTSARKHGR